MPPSVTGLRVALKLTGGVGDTVIALGGTAAALRAERPGEVVAVVMYHQMDLMREMEGIDDAIEAQKFNRLDIQMGFDVIITFASVFNSVNDLRRGGYYKLAGQRANRPVGPGEFSFKRAETTPRVVVLHPASSNPNRRWDEEKWTKLAYAIRDSGSEVQWLGTRDEFGFTDKGIHKLSDDNSNLVWQARQVAKASFFVGGDSGFGHIAGVLGIPGIILFGNTHPNDVIDCYESLRGVHKFTSYEQPSRSLKPDCPKSMDAMNRIEVDDVTECIPST